MGALFCFFIFVQGPSEAPLVGYEAKGKDAPFRFPPSPSRRGDRKRSMAKNGNGNLHDSARNKQDEFYTNLQLIEDELKHYRAHFKGCRVLCNCDDPWESNFFKFFAMNFNALGLKSLTATCYATSPVAQMELDLFGSGGTGVPPVHGANGQDARSPKQPRRTKQPYKIVITEVKDENGDGRVDLADVEWLVRNRKNVLTRLKGDGDFRSKECIALMDEADIVVTNPPFSLFREYMALLMQHGKRFLIIGNMNAVTYREIFPLIRDNKVWLGNKAGHFWFKVPDNYDEKATDFKIDENGQKWRRMGNICWFTNLDFEKRHEKMLLWKKYSPKAYPKYDNYDAIEVGKTADIPCDWQGAIGVPITFMSQYNPDQFEILGLDDHRIEWVGHGPKLHGKTMYRRIIIRLRAEKGEQA